MTKTYEQLKSELTAAENEFDTAPDADTRKALLRQRINLLAQAVEVTSEEVTGTPVSLPRL